MLAYRLPRMLKIALGAWRRTESRGAHFREDHPERNDRDWLKRTLFSWPDELAGLPNLDYEPLDVRAMELPPGFRGYGTKNLVLEHPDANSRQVQVNQAQGEGGDRHAIQERLMPLRHLLPECYRGNNERLCEPLPCAGP